MNTPTPLNDRINQRKAARFQESALKLFAEYCADSEITSHPAYLLIGAFVRLIACGLMEDTEGIAEVKRHLESVDRL